MRKFELIEQVNDVIENAFVDIGNDLQGGSLLDLCADQLPTVDLDDLQWAILAAGVVKSRCSSRLWSQALSYET